MAVLNFAENYFVSMLQRSDALSFTLRFNPALALKILQAKFFAIAIK